MNEAASDQGLAAGPEDWRERIQALAVQLNALRTLREPRCASRVPVLGPLVAAARRFGNWMSTQWYARPLLEQQNRFNEQAVRALDELADLLMRLREGQEREEQALRRLEERIAAAAELERLAEQEERRKTLLHAPPIELEPLPAAEIAGEPAGGEARAQPNLAALRVTSAEANRRLDELIQGVNDTGGTYHRLDFGGGLVMLGIYDIARYLHLYHLPQDLSGKSVLDIGTASGYFALECARRGGKVTAIDIFDRPLLSHLLPLINAAVTYVQKSIYELDPTWGEFDLVICGSLLCHLPDPVGAVQRIRSVCRGQAIVATVCSPDSQTNPRPICEFHGIKAAEGDFWNYWDISALALRAMLLAAGFSEVKNTEHFTLAGEAGGAKYVTHHVAMTGVV